MCMLHRPCCFEREHPYNWSEPKEIGVKRTAKEGDAVVQDMQAGHYIIVERKVTVYVLKVLHLTLHSFTLLYC